MGTKELKEKSGHRTGKRRTAANAIKKRRLTKRTIEEIDRSFLRSETQPQEMLENQGENEGSPEVRGSKACRCEEQYTHFRGIDSETLWYRGGTGGGTILLRDAALGRQEAESSSHYGPAS